MAGSRTLPILLSLLILGAIVPNVHAITRKYQATAYEIGPDSVTASLTMVFGPLVPDLIQNKGIGFVKNNPLQTASGQNIGYVGGLFFTLGVTNTTVEDVMSVYFDPKLGGVWGGSSLNLRGLWKLENGLDATYQELAIVGGTLGFRGASGSAFYTITARRPPRNVMKVTFVVYVDEQKRAMLDDMEAIHSDFDSVLLMKQ